MRRWSAALIIPLGAFVLAGAVRPARAVAPLRVNMASHPLAPRTSRGVRDQGATRHGSGDGVGARRLRDGGGRFGDIDDYGDDLGYGLAGGLIGAVGARSDADAPFPYGAPPPSAFPGGPFPGVRPSTPPPCARPRIITIGRGVRAADKVRVVYGAPPPCGP